MCGGETEQDRVFTLATSIGPNVSNQAHAVDTHKMPFVMKDHCLYGPIEPTTGQKLKQIGALALCTVSQRGGGRRYARRSTLAAVNRVACFLLIAPRSTHDDDSTIRTKVNVSTGGGIKAQQLQ